MKAALTRPFSFCTPISSYWYSGDDLQPPGARSVTTVLGELPEAATASRRHGALPGERSRHGHCHNSHQEKSQAAASSGGSRCPVDLLSGTAGTFVTAPASIIKPALRESSIRGLELLWALWKTTARQLPMGYQADRRN